MSHYNMVHKPIPILKEMTSLEEKVPLDKEWTKLQKLPAWDESKMTSKAEVTRIAKLEGKKVHFVTIMDLCHLKKL